MTDRNRVSAHYDQAADAEYARLTQSPLHQVEWLLTLDLIHEYVSPGASWRWDASRREGCTCDGLPHC